MTFLERTVVNSHPGLDYEVTSDDEAAAAGEAAGGVGDAVQLAELSRSRSR